MGVAFGNGTQQHLKITSHSSIDDLWDGAYTLVLIERNFHASGGTRVYKDAGSGAGYFWVYGNTNPVFEHYRGSGGVTSNCAAVTTTLPINTDVFTFYVFNRSDGSQWCRIFKGTPGGTIAEVSYASNSGTTDPGAANDAGNDIWLGSSTFGGKGTQVSRFMVVAKAMSTTEMYQAIHAPSALAGSDLRCWLEPGLLAGVGSTQPDLSGNGNDGVPTNTPTAAAHMGGLTNPFEWRMRGSVSITAAAGIVSGVGASAGVAAASAVGAATFAAVAASAGLAAASGVGASIAAAVGAGAGSAASAAVGLATVEGVGAAAGLASAAAVGASISAGVGASAGLAASAAIGASDSAGVGAAAGLGAAAGVGASTAAAVGSSSGSAASAAVAGAGEGAGMAAGLATAAAVGASTAAAVGSAGGMGTSAASGASIAAAVGSSAGFAAAAAVGDTPGASGTAAGMAVATGVGASVSAAVGLAAGLASVTAAAAFESPGVGGSFGVASATGVGAAIVAAIGNAAGQASSTAVGQDASVLVAAQPRAVMQVPASALTMQVSAGPHIMEIRE